MGTNYGLNDTLIYRELELDSYDTPTAAVATSASSDWPLFTLERPMTDIAAMKILEVSIPFSWYVFNSANNTFTLDEPGGTGLVTIPVGNYTASNLPAVLGNALTATSATGGLGGFTYTVTYSSITQKFTITATGIPNGDTFGLVFGPGTGPIGNVDPSVMLGAHHAQTSSVASGSVATLVMPDAALITGPVYLYVNSNTMGQLCNVYLPSGSDFLGALGPTFAKIPINTNPGGTVIWSDPDPQKWFDVERQASLNTLDLYLSLGNWSSQTPLQLNGLSFSIKLGFLLNQKDHDEIVSGSFGDNRVVARNAPASIARKRRRA